eukprot:gene13892-biopygen10431
MERCGKTPTEHNTTQHGTTQMYTAPARHNTNTKSSYPTCHLRRQNGEKGVSGSGGGAAPRRDAVQRRPRRHLFGTHYLSSHPQRPAAAKDGACSRCADAYDRRHPPPTLPFIQVQLQPK